MNYYVLAFISIIITVGAQILVSSRYNKYKNVLNKHSLSGFEVCKKLLSYYKLDDIYVIETKGYLSDHYDPSNNVIRLSSEVFHGESISSLAIAAHEASHALQYKEGNKFIKIRSLIFPVVNFCSKFGYLVIMLGFIFGMLHIFYAGIVMLCFILLFQIVTLPVEFDASKKAIVNLEKYKLLDKGEISGAKDVLFAAALTYVASLATTVIEIFRLIILADDRR